MAVELLEEEPKEHNRRYFCTKEKLRAIARVKSGERQRPVAHSLGITMDTLREWIAQLAATDWANGVKVSNPANDLLDRAVYTWYIQQLQAELRPTPDAVLKKSSVFANRLYGTGAMVGPDMLERWKARHGINLDEVPEPNIGEIHRELAADLEFAKLEIGTPNKELNGKGSNKRKSLSNDKPLVKRLKKKSLNKDGVNSAKKKRTKINGENCIPQKRRRQNSDNSEKENSVISTSSATTVTLPAETSKPVEVDSGSRFVVAPGASLDKLIKTVFKRNIQPSNVTLNEKDTSNLSDRIKVLENEMIKLDMSLNSLKKFPLNFRAALLLADDSLIPSTTSKKFIPKSLQTYSKGGSGPNVKYGPTVKVKDGMLPSDVDDNSPIEYTNDTRMDVIHVGQNKLERQHLPPFGAVVRKDLQIGMQVFAAKTNTLGIWVRARVLEVKIINNEGLLGIVYRIKYESKKHGYTRLCPPKLLAYVELPSVTLPVGSRVIARYKEDSGEYHHALYAGIIAEPPKSTNSYRYLIFFDDGYAQYVRHFEVHLVCSGKKEVWEEIHEDSREFIKKYLKQYPERPMVKLQKGQTVLTEWNGSWWNAKTTKVDGSLVEMYFDSDKRTEWIYRGSTRLAPLFNELNRTMQTQLSGKPSRRHNTMIKKKDRPYVEYTRNESDEETRIDSPDLVTIEDDPKLPNTARKHTAEMKQTARKSTTQEFTIPVVIQKKASTYKATIDPSTAISQKGTIDICEKDDFKRVVFAAHRCSSACIALENVFKHKGQNPVRVPLLCGWQRETSKKKPGTKKSAVYYRAPCGRRFGDISQVAHFLNITKSHLTIDLFTFNEYVHTFSQFKPLKICFYLKDMTYGKEPVPVCCINSLDKDHPPFVEYSAKRFPAPGVEFNTDPEFLCGCDCEDNCQNRDKCQCQQLSIAASAAVPGGPIPDVGYKYRRLHEPVLTGIYECNSHCKCRSSCFNRVAQNGLLARLQVFKTEQRGWGIRCLDDIPQGMFICNYAGQLLNEQLANEDGNQYGDEYQAELDHIEVVERMKEGYESDVVEEGEGYTANTKTSNSNSKFSDDDDWLDKLHSDSDSDFKNDSDSAPKSDRRTLRKRLSVEDSSSNDSARLKNEQKSNSTSSNNSVDGDRKKDGIVKKDDFSGFSEKNESEFDPKMETKDETSSSSSSRKSSISQQVVKVVPKEDSKDTTFSIPREKFVSVRSYFNEEYCYIMDAKISGNIGRYLNHSCCPNVFVQNVFVDSHDLRFPWVAFFAAVYIRAGTELTWDYNYDVGSVPGKVMYCHCGSAECRGRLL